MFGLITVTVGIVLVGYLIVKKYYAPWALLYRPSDAARRRVIYQCASRHRKESHSQHAA